MTVYYSPGAPNVFGPGTYEYRGGGHTPTPREIADIIGSGEGIGEAGRQMRSGHTGSTGTPDPGSADGGFGAFGYQHGEPGSFAFNTHVAAMQLAAADARNAANAANAASGPNLFESAVDAVSDFFGDAGTAIGDAWDAVSNQVLPTWTPGAGVTVNQNPEVFPNIFASGYQGPTVVQGNVGDLTTSAFNEAAYQGVKHGLGTAMNMGFPGAGLLLYTPPGQSFTQGVTDVGVNILGDVVGGTGAALGGVGSGVLGGIRAIGGGYDLNTGGSFGGHTGQIGAFPLAGVGNIGNIGSIGNLGSIGSPGNLGDLGNAGGANIGVPGVGPGGEGGPLTDYVYPITSGLGSTSDNGLFGGRDGAEGWAEYLSSRGITPTAGGAP